jgi:hypothetical protein
MADTLVVSRLFSLTGVLAAGLLGLSWLTVSRLGSRMDRFEDRQRSLEDGQRSLRSEILERLDLIAERVSHLEGAG